MKFNKIAHRAILNGRPYFAFLLSSFTEASAKVDCLLP